MKQYPQQAQISIGAVIIHQEKALLIKRAQEPSKGLWSVPGGCIQLGEPMQAALKREVFEETNVVVGLGDLIYHCEIIQRDDEDKIKFHYVILDFIAHYHSGVARAATDALEAKWVALQMITSYPCADGIIELFEKAKKLIT